MATHAAADSGRVAVVTGAGSGLGRAAAELLLRNGTRVAAWDLDIEPLAADHHDDVHDVHLDVVDVTDEHAVAAAAANVETRFGRADAVINCAGRFLVGALESVPATEVRNLFDVNLVGTTLVTQATLPFLRQSRGAIVNVSSVTALKATPSNAHYAASKAAIAQLTKCWALELGPEGIRVNAVAPGPVPTNVYTNAGMTREQTEALLLQRKEGAPLRRNGTAEEVAAWIARLALADEWVTGQVIAVDGGMSIS